MDAVSPGSNIARQLPDLCACVSIVHQPSLLFRIRLERFFSLVTNWKELTYNKRKWHSNMNAQSVKFLTHSQQLSHVSCGAGALIKGCFAPVLVVKGRLGPISARQLFYMCMPMRPNKAETTVRVWLNKVFEMCFFIKGLENSSNILDLIKSRFNRPFAVYDPMVQKPPCWRANYPLEHPKQNNIKLSCIVLDVPVGSLLSSMAVFVPCDRKLQSAY